jgi:hypothetical protein
MFNFVKLLIALSSAIILLLYKKGECQYPHYEHTFGFVLASSFGNRPEFARHKVVDIIGFAIFRVDSTDQHVIGNVIQVTAVLQPWTGSTMRVNFI